MKFRGILALALNSVVAILGVTVIAWIIHRLFHESPVQTDAGVLQKEFIESTSIGFVLGYVVYFKWQTRTALWAWLFGASLLVFAAALDFSESGFTWEGLAIVSFVPIRAVAYSVGARACRQMLKLRSNRSEPGGSPAAG